MRRTAHQYIERETGKIRTERLFGDLLIRAAHSGDKENPSLLFRSLISARASKLLGLLTFDFPLNAGSVGFQRRWDIDLGECVDDPKALNTARKLFERKIRYWECRPMPGDPAAVVSPADSRVLVGSLNDASALFLKEKFFSLEELLGRDKEKWISAFKGGDFAIFRLTPDKYHYNHAPVSGVVSDIYEIPGGYHSCNPGAVIQTVQPYSKNKRVVTIISTDVPDGSCVGLVAMIEIAALMVGDIVQCYSSEKYEAPIPVVPGLFLRKGCPKSLFRPGSSTDVLLFQKGRIKFSEDIVRNMLRHGIQSRFSQGFGRPLAETDLKVRSVIGQATSPNNSVT